MHAPDKVSAEAATLASEKLVASVPRLAASENATPSGDRSTLYPLSLVALSVQTTLTLL